MQHAVLAACKEFPNFKGFKFDQRQQQNVQKPPETQRTANIQKYSSLGRRPLPQTPDEKARKQPPVPKVPTTSIETPLNPANFRSLQRGAWQDNVSTFQPNVQFRSLQRGISSQPSHSQFRSAKIQDQTQSEAMYANSESERQLYAVTEFDIDNTNIKASNMSDGTFLVSISGQIEWIDVLAPAGTSWHCKYELFSGPDWKIIGGLVAGLSQVANVVNNGDKVVLNFPIEVQFKSTNPYGWPQIILSVYRNMHLEGYGRAHMPLKPGSHQLDVYLSKPQASSLLGYIGSFFGYQPELLQPKMLATTAGNNLIRMESTGQAHVTVNVVTQEFQTLGYDVGKI
ncbi:hypothetical protein NQ318_014080 [Aromia moschata]|uniref:B9 domain-containing protein 1 n=1 Tax=Aromia moschata TaxID=1265417 RepID=A0AAV8Z0Z1_9CUCU|nr:hypothetical protein NQ318_014080 [Aromia moschata]